MKGCIFNRLTIFCLVVVFGGLFFMLLNMWPKPPFPESERYGVYYNPYHDICMGFLDGDDCRYILFSRDYNTTLSSTADYIKIEKSRKTSFNIYFFNDSIGRLNILLPSDGILESSIDSAHSHKFVIDTLPYENSRNFALNSHTGYYGLTVSDYSSMECIEGFVSLAYKGSRFSPLCSVR